jgi:chromosome segregation protein
MYLKSIEISGFKSFAKKVELDFTSKVSAIVGPNGSGKSNIAESFRFVLGEQSIKSLRGKRGEDLIWNGSTELPRSGKASVKVTFDNTSRFLSLDFDTVTIERAVHRDGVNEYFLNGSLVRLKDIIELLAGAHIGSSGHHIISQGEADRILNASIKDRKTMIEEALGLKVYQYKKLESLKKLQKTKENIAQVESLRREIAPHIRFLKKQVEKVEKAVAMKVELLEIAREYFNRENHYIRNTENEIRKTKDPLEKKLDEARKNVAHAKDILKGVETRDVRSDELLNIESHLRKIRKDKDDISHERGRIEGELASSARMLKRQEEMAHSTEWKTVEMQAVEALQNEIFCYVDVIEKSADPREIKKAVDAIRSLFKAFVEMRKDTTDSGAIKDIQIEIERLGKDRERVEKEITHLSSEEKKTEDSYTALRQKIEQDKETDRDAEKKLFQSMADEKLIISELHALDAREEALHSMEEDYRRDVGEMGMLLGRDILHFDTLTFDYTEERHAQDERKRAMEKIKIRLEDSGGAGGDETLKEYNEAMDRDTFLQKELADLSGSAESLTSLISELDGKISEEFGTGLVKINTQFQEFFALMFGGGNAELSVIKQVKKKKSDTDDLLAMDSEGEVSEEEEDGGIDIAVSLPRKKTKGLIQLSGGERALTSIALLFAISQVNPPPFIILDETDAALDEANSKKYGDMIETLSKFSQLIVITHNRETMSRAGVLYGVTMGSGGVSKLLSVAFEEAVAVAK